MASPDTKESQTWRLSPDLLGIVDQQGRFVETNPAWQAVLGWSQEEIRARIFVDFLHPDDVEPTISLFQDMKSGSPALHFENRYQTKDGDYKWLSWVAVQEGDRFICSARDVTIDKMNVRTLKTRDDEALLREQFVAILGHDLRNPLAAIEAAIALAALEPHNEKIGEMLGYAMASTNRMVQLINVTMDFAKARLGGGLAIDLRMSENLKADLSGVIDEIRLSNPARDIRLDYAFDAELLCDQSRLMQMLSNLVANAVTHGSEDGSIRVVIGKQEGRFSIAVTNTGQPIPKEVLPNLFKPFARPGNDNSLNGLGLGLYIADQISREHQGDLVAASANGETCFTFSMPTD